MNKLRLLAFAFVLGTTSLFANVNPDVSKDEIRQQIIELVKVADNTIATETAVTVIFSFSSEGEIVILKVDSIDQDVISFVRENLNGKTVENPAKPGRNFTMSIVLK